MGNCVHTCTHTWQSDPKPPPGGVHRRRGRVHGGPALSRASRRVHPPQVVAAAVVAGGSSRRSSSRRRGGGSRGGDLAAVGRGRRKGGEAAAEGGVAHEAVAVLGRGPGRVRRRFIFFCVLFEVPLASFLFPPFSIPDLPVDPEVEVDEGDGREESEREELLPPAAVADEQLVHDQGDVRLGVSKKKKKCALFLRIFDLPLLTAPQFPHLLGVVPGDVLVLEEPGEVLGDGEADDDDHVLPEGGAVAERVADGLVP